MKPLPAVLFLLSAMLSAGADRLSEIQQAITEQEATLSQLQSARQVADEDLIALVGKLPSPPTERDESMPERNGNETVAVADSGMMFDANNYRVVYIHNVRVADPRMELRCADRLFIHFPKKTADSGKSAVKNTATTGLNKDKPAQQAQQKQEPAATTEAPTTTEAATSPQSVIRVNTTTTMVNAVSNLIYLEGTAEAGNTVTLSREQDELKLTSTAEQAAALLAAPNGNLLIKSGQIDLKWTDSRGKPCTLHNEQGTAFYQSDTQELHFLGHTEAHTAEGSIRSEKLLTLKLTVKESGKTSSFMPRFTDIRIEGVESATAEGQVHLTRPATDSAPASTISGEHLTYNSKTGTVTVSGPQTTLTYGEQKLSTDGSLHLAENGDITLQGNAINGVYQRPGGEKGEAPIAGTFTTSGNITFTADTHTISMPNGIKAQDALSHITALGQVDIVLQPDPQAKAPDRSKTGMLNLAIAQHKDIAAIRATGGVDLQYRDNPQEEGLTIVADDADLNFLTAEATFIAAAGKTNNLKYNGYHISAISDSAVSTLYLAPNGDLTLTGDKVAATLPDKDKTTQVNCTESLTLVRESGVLTLGPQSKVHAAEGILTAKGKLHLLLYPGPAEKNRPAMKRYPHLVFNYAGLKQADTENGGTLQAKQGSMQCSGPIHVEMLPENTTDNPMGAIRRATARGNVALAGKDNQGRLMRATGDLLTIDGKTGTKVLSGNRVTLQDVNNTHIASGGGAKVVLDSRNNVRISGAKQSTTATKLNEQIDKNQDKK